jgi:AraC-like DNA-binding protein
MPPDSPDAEVYFNYTSLDDELPIEIAFAGVSDWGPSSKWSRTQSPTCSIELTLEGDGIVTIDGQEYTVEAGDLLFFHVEEDEDYHTGRSGVWRKLFVGFRRGLMVELMQHLDLRHRTIIKLDATYLDRAERLMRTIITLIRDQPDNYRYKASMQAYRLLLLAGAAVRAEHEREAPPGVLRAIRYAEQHLHTRLPVAELTRVAGYSRSHFQRLFHQHTGLSVHQWVIQARIQRACMMLAVTNHSVKSIAYAVGYSDPYQFSAAFRKAMGMPPTAYRRHIRQPA